MGCTPYLQAPRGVISSVTAVLNASVFPVEGSLVLFVCVTRPILFEALVIADARMNIYPNKSNSVSY